MQAVMGVVESWGGDMPLPLAEAKSLARSQLRGKNAKPADVNRLAQKLVEESYDNQSSGQSYSYKTGTGQGMQHKGRGGGDSVEYQTSDLSNYIDKVLEQGGLRDVQRPSNRPGTGGQGQEGLPEEGPIPASRDESGGQEEIAAPVTTDTGDDEKTIKQTLDSGLSWEQIAAGAAGMAALVALYRLGRKYKDPNTLRTAVESTEVPEGAKTPSPEAQEPIERETNNPRQIEAEERRLLTYNPAQDAASADIETRATPEESLAEAEQRVSPDTVSEEDVDTTRYGPPDADESARQFVETGGDRASSQSRYPSRQTIIDEIDRQVADTLDREYATQQPRAAAPETEQLPPGLMDRVMKMRYSEAGPYLRKMGVSDVLLKRILSQMASRAGRP
jgi:hypothetical protein